MAHFEHNLAAYNAVEAARGGTGVQPNDMVAVRAIAVLEGVSGGPASISDDNMALRLNAIDVGTGGTGTHENTLDALNSIVVLKGGLGGHENDLDALNEWADLPVIFQLLFDTFTDVAGTELSAHTPDVDPGLGPYDELSGDHEIIAGNKLGINITAGVFFKDIGKAIGYSKIDVVEGGANNPAVIFNGIDIDNFWMLQALETDDEIRLFENTTAGGFIVRATAAFVWTTAITIKLERVTGDTLRGFADDMNTPILTFVSALHNTGTNVGLRSNISTQEFDNLEGFG